jgi:hypothetical protein
MARRRRVLPPKIGGLVVVVGLVGLGITYYWASSVGADAERARSVQAEMLKCRLMQAGTYYLRVKYRYQVNGKQYVSTKFERFPGGDSSGSSNIDYWESQEERFCKAKKVTAYYNPDDPAEAYLVNNDWFALLTILYIASGLTLLTGCILLGVSFWQRKQAV